jgi:hypothetical protein
MRVYWMLKAGENIEIFDGQDGSSKGLVYRVGVERFIQAEVKVIHARQPAAGG